MADKNNLNTEEKIKEAARKVFLKKGYAATRTRDIAEEAGINLALLNYYYRSKEKLFQIVMRETLHEFFGVIFPVANDSSSSLEDKISKMVELYINFLRKNPNLPIFVLSEIRMNATSFTQNSGIEKVLIGSSFMQQLKEQREDIDVVHFLLNLLGMLVFPFISKPIITTVLKTNEEFDQLMEERKKLIPKWIFILLNEP